MKISIFTFTLFFFAFFGNTVFASEDIDYEKGEEEFEKYIEEVIEDVKELNRDTDIFENLTDEDYELLLSYVSEIETQNPGMSEVELDQLAYDFLKKRYDDTQNDLTIKPFYISIGGANSQEVALCAKHPVRCSKARLDASTASKQAESYYRSGLHNGNGDAFRHAYWNVLMVKSIGLGPAADFANAHEYGAKNQPRIEQTMDLHNNHLGRHALRGSTAAQVRNGITSGKGKRIVNSRLVNTSSAGLR